MDPKKLEFFVDWIKVIKDHFKEGFRDHRDLPTSEETVLTFLQEILLSQDSQIRSLTEPALHNGALYQAKRLVEILERRPH